MRPILRDSWPETIELNRITGILEGQFRNSWNLETLRTGLLKNRLYGSEIFENRELRIQEKKKKRKCTWIENLFKVLFE